MIAPRASTLVWSSAASNYRFLRCKSRVQLFHSLSRAYLSASPSSKDGFLGAAGTYMKSLRLMAAETLTSSLPEEERKKLLDHVGGDMAGDSSKKVDPPPPVVAVTSPSVDELIAAAKANESQRLNAQFEQEKEKLIAEMEEAARKRVESDLAIRRRQIAFEQWKQQLQHEKQTQERQHELSEESVSAASALDSTLEEHPILGPVLCDLGHKRIHVSSAKSLAALPIWEKQRSYRHDRVKSMAKDKAKTLHIGLPGIIGLYEKMDGSLSVIDGQHRVGMLKMLLDKESLTEQFDFDRILVEVYPQPNGSADEAAATHATEIFKEINKAQPANLIDLPDAVDPTVLNVINDAASHLMDEYPAMFRPSQKCRRPHLNVDNLRNDLFLAGVVERHSLKTSQALVEWIMQQNEILAQKYNTTGGEDKDLVPRQALKKAQDNNFFLGLDVSWYSN